ncbi:MAG TPA: hypothetical protein VMZ92_07760 [Planctomycetota bacterium]|nr:hypothetical protein [Planctomycetota bacterium]
MDVAMAIWHIVVLILIFCYVVRINSKVNELLRREMRSRKSIGGSETDAGRPE